MTKSKQVEVRVLALSKQSVKLRVGKVEHGTLGNRRNVERSGVCPLNKL